MNAIGERDREAVGNRIRQWRKERAKLTQVGLAEATGIDQSTISDIENGASCSYERFFAIAEAIHATADYLLGGAAADQDEVELVGTYRALKEPSRTSLVTIARALGGRQPAPHEQYASNLARELATIPVELRGAAYQAALSAIEDVRPPSAPKSNARSAAPPKKAPAKSRKVRV